MSQKITETYWKNICSMKSAGELDEFLYANRQIASSILEELADLANTFIPMKVSFFNRDLLTLGAMIADASNETEYLHRSMHPLI
jgi:hypothetical protein